MSEHRTILEFVRNEHREGEVVVHALGWRVRVYAGHTGRARRFDVWSSELGSIGAYVRPWRDRALGVQWRRVRPALVVELAEEELAQKIDLERADAFVDRHDPIRWEFRR